MTDRVTLKIGGFLLPDQAEGSRGPSLLKPATVWDEDAQGHLLLQRQRKGLNGGRKDQETHGDKGTKLPPARVIPAILEVESLP